MKIEEVSKMCTRFNFTYTQVNFDDLSKLHIVYPFALLQSVGDNMNMLAVELEEDFIKCSMITIT